jgi:fatty aldehyde-generating acyl-ACP reductase
MSARPAFAALGHQESWSRITQLVSEFRPRDAAPLTEAQVRELIPWIPPRAVTRFGVCPAPGRSTVPGVYVDTFITPDELGPHPTPQVLGKVRDGIEAARREGARLVTLGGFTSILLESMAIEPDAGLALTTGNTLTTALILLGVERALEIHGRSLADEDVLVIGATGDIGSACARCLAGRVRRLLLVARNAERLEREAQHLGPRVEASTDGARLLGKATVVIAVASVPEPTFFLQACRRDALICDAGYPKNIRAHVNRSDSPRVFWGGMGALACGLSGDGMLAKLYRFPVPDVAHGCILEGAVLAMAGRFEPFSVGRGRITPERVDEMWRLAAAHGVRLAPLFDAAGRWPEEAIA